MGVAPRIPGGGSHFKSLIPVMTANSQNGYIVSASNKLDGEPYYAFDGNCKIKNWAETNGGTQYVLLLEKADISKSSFHQPQKLLVRLLLAQITTKQASALAAA